MKKFLPIIPIIGFILVWYYLILKDELILDNYKDGYTPLFFLSALVQAISFILISYLYITQIK